jgi:hypothetical protein
MTVRRLPQRALLGLMLAAVTLGSAPVHAGDAEAVPVVDEAPCDSP